MSYFAEIPYVPEGVLDPSAAINQLAYVMSSVSQASVISMGDNSPPGDPGDGDLYIVGTSPTGDWASQGDNLAKYVSEGDYWDFFQAGTLIRWVIDISDGTMHFYEDSSNAGWVAVS